MVAVARWEPARAVQDAAGGVVAPLRGAVLRLADGVAALFGVTTDTEQLRLENAALARELADADSRLAALEEAARENERLRELLDIRGRLGLESIASEVISRDASNLVDVVGIDAGRSHGVAAEMPVVSGAPDGAALVGTVLEAAADRSEVLLVTDGRSRAVALDQRTRALGVVVGGAGGQLKLIDVPATDELRAGDLVLTAGLAITPQARSRYPAGLLIGRIVAVEPDANGVTQTAYLRPAADLAHVGHVLVIVGMPASDD